MDTARKLELDRSRQAAPQVFEHLRRTIISLELVPGARLSRHDLGARLGVSATPVRDALIRLGEEGLVEVHAQRATFVSRISLQAARRAWFLQRAVALEVAETLARDRGAASMGRLQVPLEAGRQALARGDAAAFAAAEESFHRRLHEAAGVGELWALARRVGGDLDRLERLERLTVSWRGRAEVAAADQVAIVEAIMAGDATAAREATHRCLAAALGEGEQAAKRFPGYITD